MKCENTKKITISSCTDLVGDHRAHRRDVQRGFVGEKEEKRRRGRRRREKEREET